MSDRTFSRELSLWEKFENKEYRDGFVASHIGNNIASQLFSTRELRGWTQQELAEKAGMAQGRISLMENSSYEKFSLSTLKRLASALDVALVVRFVPFSELAEYATSMGPDKLAVRDFRNDYISSGAPLAIQDPLPDISVSDFTIGQIIDLPITERPRAGTYQCTGGLNYYAAVNHHAINDYTGQMSEGFLNIGIPADDLFGTKSVSVIGLEAFYEKWSTQSACFAGTAVSTR